MLGRYCREWFVKNVEKFCVPVGVVSGSMVPRMMSKVVTVVGTYDIAAVGESTFIFSRPRVYQVRSCSCGVRIGRKSEESAWRCARVGVKDLRT